jgi:peroxiredoxin
MDTTKTLRVGDLAPNFVLKDQNDNDVRLSAFKGRKVLLSFHPLAWTPVCAKQMRALEKHCEEFKKLNTVALGMSIDHVPCKYAWAKSLRIRKTALPADFWPHGAVGKLYGLFRESDGFTERANVIVDEDRRIVFIKIYEPSQLPNIQEIINFLKKARTNAGD